MLDKSIIECEHLEHNKYMEEYLSLIKNTRIRFDIYLDTCFQKTSMRYIFIFSSYGIILRLHDNNESGNS